MLVGLKEILALAQAGGYAIPAFNVYNMETVIGCITAAEDLHAPVILQTYSRLFKEGSRILFGSIRIGSRQKRRGASMLSSGSWRIGIGDHSRTAIWLHRRDDRGFCYGF